MEDSGEIVMEWIVIGTALAAGMVQGITGFGGGIVLMLVLPNLFALTQAAGVNSAILVFLNSTMVLVYRKHIRWNLVIPVFLYSIVVASMTIHFAAGANPVIIKKMFGVFLLLLSVYYLFIKKDGRPAPMSVPVTLVFLTAAAICDGLFGISGPMLVVYFLSRCEDRYEYLANLQTTFLLSGAYNTCFRIYSGILQPEHLPVILCGAAAIIAGGLIAKRLADKLNADILTKMIYVVIAFSGVTNLL